MASDITGKGVPTANNATYQVMANNISMIKSSVAPTYASVDSASIGLAANRKYIVISVASGGPTTSGSNNSYSGTNWSMSAVSASCAGASVANKISRGPLYNGGYYCLSYRVDEVMAGGASHTFTTSASAVDIMLQPQEFFAFQ